MFTYLRPVRFEDVDAARIVFFSRFLNYCHEAMEALFGDLEGGYVGLVVERQIGLPAVHVKCDFKAPLRYGDVARIVVTVDRIGRSSCAFRYAVARVKDDVAVAVIVHVCAVSDLVELRAISIPDDMRALMTKHLSPRAP